MLHSEFQKLFAQVAALSGMPREVVWKRLKDDGVFWKDAGRIGKAEWNLFPRPRTELPLQWVFAARQDGAEERGDEELLSLLTVDTAATPRAFPEVYAVQPLRDFVRGSEARKANVAILLAALSGELAALPGRRRGGGVALPESPEVVALRERESPLREMERVAEYALPACEEQAVTGADGEDASQKRRRMTEKTSALARFRVSYEYKQGWRSRRYASSSPSAQGMDQRLQKLVLRDTVDFDVVNCMPTLLFQMVDRLRLVDESTWKDELVLLRRLAYERQTVCETDLGVPASLGKKMIHQMLQGGAVPAELANNATAKGIVSLARFLRWWACSLAPHIHEVTRGRHGEDPKKWPESSTLAYVWQGLEDHILDAMVQYVEQKPTQHVSLHFDGLRVDRARVTLDLEEGVSSMRDGCAGADEVAMCARMATFVKQATGYDVLIVAKSHFYLLEHLEGVPREPVDPTPHCRLLDAGNSIPLALTLLTGKDDPAAQYTSELVHPSQPEAPLSRAYRDVGLVFRVTLVPTVDRSRLRVGRWLLHVENGGLPHCVALDFRTPEECIVLWKGFKTVMSFAVLRGLIDSSVDKKTLVLYEVLPGDASASTVQAHIAPLLDMLAV